MAKAFKMNGKIYPTIMSIARELGLKRVFRKQFEKYGIVDLTEDSVEITTSDQINPEDTTKISPNIQKILKRMHKNPVHYKVMTVIIDESKSDPAERCIYADDAVGMTAGSDDWDEFFGHYPCLLKNGRESYRLNPLDYALDIDGNAADITSGNSGDVMVAFPKRGLKISKSGSITTVSMTDDPNNIEFKYSAHKRGSMLKDKFYLGAYMGSEISSKLRSLSGVYPAFSKTIGEFRDLAQANGKPDGSGGSGYDQSGFFQLLYRQCMFLLKYKSLDSLQIIGQGADYVMYNRISPALTGETNKLGMDSSAKYHDPNILGTPQCKLFGIEDAWGNLQEWVDGIISGDKSYVWTATQGFNDTGEGYTMRGLNQIIQLKTAPLWTPQNYARRFFLPANSRFVARFGGYRNQFIGGGMFSLTAMDVPQYLFEGIGSRLMYL